jgi:hypothetical protein
MSHEAPPTDAASVRAKIADPRPPAIAFVTTEHFTLQGGLADLGLRQRRAARGSSGSGRVRRHD